MAAPNRTSASVVARYSIPGTLVGWVQIPLLSWIVFGVGGLWTEWWAWLAAALGFPGMALFVVSPWRFTVSGDELEVFWLVSWPPGRKESVDMSRTRVSYAPRGAFGHVFGCDVITTSDGRRFNVWSSYIRNAALLRGAIEGAAIKFHPNVEDPQQQQAVKFQQQ